MTTGTEPSELERVKKELEHEHDLYLRSLADFENYRRRVERDRESSARRDKRAMLLSMIDLLDGFDRALPHLSDAPTPALEGIMAIHRQLLNLLKAQGVTPFDTEGERFDPELHEAVGSERSDQDESGTVTGEVRRGYRWGDELLRPARVRVAQ